MACSNMIFISFALLNLFIDLLNAGCCCSKEEREKIETFDQYKKCFKHSFHPDDDGYRQQVFHQNLQTIKNLKSVHKNTEFGLNKFSHLSHEEFKKKFLGFKSSVEYDPTYKKAKGKFPIVDWREKGVVAKIKNQKACGSCYAFSAISVMESHHAIKTGSLVTYSEQQAVDCSMPYGNNGCNGGLMDLVFNYTKDYGLMTDNDYPYIAKLGACEYNQSAVALNITGWTDIASGSEDDLTQAIRKIGPVAVAIDAGQPSFMFYSGGIYDDVNCSSYQLNHAVTAVGVARDYYIVRNSWGKGWGEEGYFRLARNHGNRCGIATVASYPNLG